MDEILKKADFSAGSDHKEKLKEKLFTDEKENDWECLSDEELDLAAAGTSVGITKKKR